MIATHPSIAHARLLAWVAASLALLGASADLLAQVSQIQVRKMIRYDQVSASDVIVGPSEAYWFQADVDGTNIGGITPPTIAGPIDTAALGARHNNGVLVYNAADAGWRWGTDARDFRTSSREELDRLFGSGTYTFTVNGVSVPLTLSGDSFPNPPLVTLTGGRWSDGTYLIDPAQPLTITTNAFTGYGTHLNDTICVLFRGTGFVGPEQSVITNCPYRLQRASDVPGSNSMTVTVPPGSFAANEEYLLGTSFTAITNARTVAGLPGSSNTARYGTQTRVKIKSTTPVFPMTVTTNITAVSASASAAIQFRPQDIGTTGSVYVFAVAPADLVKAAAEGAASFAIGKAIAAGGAKEDSVACVLAQLNASGQLQAVSASSLQAYVTGVLSAQGQAVTILNGVATVNIGGATFYVGYGTSATAMINGGINRSAFTVPGNRECKPQAPQKGWWWNPQESGRGFTIETSGNTLFMAAYLYDISGRATWHVAAGPTSLDGSVFNGQLWSFANGVTLGGSYKPNAQRPDAGPVTLTFDDAQHGTLVWPGGTVAIERFAYGANGTATPPLANQPESGWWWNAGENGRGYFIEWQGNVAFMAGYMYDDAGNAIWYTSDAVVTNPGIFQGSWQQFANGQTMTGAYRAPTTVSLGVAPVTIQFQGADTAILTLPGRQLPLTRFRF